MRFSLALLVKSIVSFATRTFYRFEVAGEEIPRSGPLLLIANHPDLAADPACVVTAAGRPVRFLTKAPLFSLPVIGRLLAALGMIPIRQKSEQPADVEKNRSALDLAERALSEEGSVIGIFPEGKSHQGPSLAPLKTGAARIALGAVARLAGAETIPIIPVGISYRDQKRFRSRTIALVGSSVAYSDLLDDSLGAEKLTERIEEALRSVTVNLESWEDRPAIEAAEAIYAAELTDEPDAELRIARLQEIASGLARLRRSHHDALEPLYERVVEFDRLLGELGLRPRDLDACTRTAVGMRWLVGRIFLLALILPFLLPGLVIFAVPYLVTAIAVPRITDDPGTAATLKILGGGSLHLVWMVFLALLLGGIGGWPAAIAALLVLPPYALLTIALTERWKRIRREGHRFLLLRSHRTLRDQLVAERAAIAGEMRRVVRRG